MSRTSKPPTSPSPISSSIGTAVRPLLFSPPQAAARPPRAPRCPDIYMLGPGDARFTLTALIAALVEGRVEPDLTRNAALPRP